MDINFLKIVSLNARSMVNKFLNFHFEVIAEHDPHIVSISETWLHGQEEYPNGLFCCSNAYVIYRCDRMSSQGGGVALIIKKELKSQLLFSSPIVDGEILWVKVNLGDTSLIVASFYRSNVSKLEPLDKLFEDINSLKDQKCPILLLGDFNLPDIDWSVPCAKNAHGQEEYLLKFQRNGFLQYVDCPTRGTNILDLILCNSPNLIYNVRVGEPLAASDHNMVLFNFLCNYKCGNNGSTNYNWRKCNFYDVARTLELVPWNALLGPAQNVDEMYSTFLNVFHHVAQIFVPVVGIRPLAKRIMSRKRSKLLHKRRRCLRRLRKTNSASDRTKFNAASIAFSNSIREEAWRSECKIIASADQKKLFKYVRSKSSFESRIPALKDGNNLVISPAERAQLLGDVFCSYFRHDDGMEPRLSRPRMSHSMPPMTITRCAIEEALKSFPNKTSCGIDGIPALALKNLATQLSIPLEFIFNSSLESGVVPSLWKEAIVVPLYKGKGRVEDAVNYRPISLTSNVCKAMDKARKGGNSTIP